MKFGGFRAFRDLAIFLAVFSVLLIFSAGGLPDVTGLIWWAFVVWASVYLIWKGWRARKDSHPSQGPGGWGAVLPPKVWRWMSGEEDGRDKDKRA
jgi:hypothetical protein